MACNAVSLRDSHAEQKSFNVFQVSHSPDSEDGKIVPLTLVPIARMMMEPPKKIRSQANVIKLLAMVHCIHAGITSHDVFEALAELVYAQ